MSDYRENQVASENTERSERRDYRNQDDRPSRSQGNRPAPRKFFRKRGRMKVCYLCKNNLSSLDYKDVPLLQRFINDRGKILPRRMTGTCSKHQRLVTRTVKTARNIALLPFAAE